MSNLLDKASIILTPTAYNNGEALCVKPSDGSGDFDFSRNSAATRVNAQGLVENVQILSSNLVQNGSFSEEGVQEVSNGSFSQEGVQLVTNGSFDTDSDWTKIGNATIQNGYAELTFDGTTGNQIRQTTLTSGKIYKVQYEILSNTGTDGQVFMNAFSNGTAIDISVGTYTLYLTAINTTFFNFRTLGGTGGSVQIDNVSVREVGQDWVIEDTWTIGDGVANGNGAVGSTSELKQYNVNTIGKTYKATFEVLNYVSGTVGFWQGSGVTVINRSANGIYTEYFTATSAEIRFRPNNFNGSITNISVKEVGQDWNLGSGTTIGDGIANITQSGGVLSQSGGILVSGKSFKITFTISNYVSGSIAVSNLTPTTYRSGNGTYTLNAVGAGGDFIFYSSSFIGSVTNISVIEISSDTNLPRINYEGFSYQDALGSELVTNGGFEDGLTDWTAYAGTISIETNIVHSGTQSAKVDGVGIQQSRSYTDGEQVYYNFWVYSTTGTSVFIQTINENVTIPLNQWVQVSGIGTINGNNSSFRIRIANGLWYIDNVSVKEYLGQEVVPDSGCGSWLFEPQSTNLIEYSNDYADAYWTVKANSSISSNAIISPDGNLNADKLVENTSSSTHYINKNSFVLISGVDYTYSVFAKAGERSNFWLRTINGVGDAYFDLSNGTITSGVGGFIEDYGNGWYRCSVSGTSTSTTGNPYIYLVKSGTTTNYLGDGTSGLYIYGFQVEQQSYATSYIPTEGATVTRNRDLCTNGGSLASINSTEGVLYAEIAALADDETNREITLSDGTTSNYVLIRFNSGGSNRIYTRVNVGGAIQYFDLEFSIDITNTTKIAIRYGDNNFATFINGSKVKGQLSGSTFPSNTLTEVAFDNGGGGANFFGKTKAVAVWKEALSDEELTELTTI